MIASAARYVRAGAVSGLPGAGRVRDAPRRLTWAARRAAEAPAATGDAPLRRRVTAAAERRRWRHRAPCAPAALRWRRVVLLAAVALAVVLLSRGTGPLPGVTPPPASLADPVPYDGRSPLQPRRARAAGARRSSAARARRAARRAGDGRRGPARLRRLAQARGDRRRARRSAARGVVLRDVVAFYRVWNGFAATVSTPRPRAAELARRARAHRAPRVSRRRSEPVPRARQAGARARRAGRRRRPSPCSTPASTARRSPATPTPATTRSTATATRRRAATRRRRPARDERDRARGRRRRGGRARAADPDRLAARGRRRGRGARRRPTRSSPGSSTPSTRTATPTRPTTCRSRLSASTRRTRASRTRPRRRRSRAPAGSARSSSRPAGNEGAAAPGSGTIGSPASAPDALAVGALAGREPRAAHSSSTATARATPPCSPARRRATARPPARSRTPTRPSSMRALTAGRIVIVRAGANPAAQAAAAAAVGAARRAARRPARAAAAGDPRRPRRRARDRRHRRGRRRVLELKPGTEVRFGAPSARPRRRRPAPRASRPPTSQGPSAGGLPKPDLAAPGSALTVGPGGGGAWSRRHRDRRRARRRLRRASSRARARSSRPAELRAALIAAADPASCRPIAPARATLRADASRGSRAEPAHRGAPARSTRSACELIAAGSDAAAPARHERRDGRSRETASRWSPARPPRSPSGLPQRRRRRFGRLEALDARQARRRLASRGSCAPDTVEPIAARPAAASTAAGAACASRSARSNAASRPSIQVAERLVLDLVDARRQRPAQPDFPGGARELMPAEYAYTLPRGARCPDGPLRVPRPRLGAAPGASRPRAPRALAVTTVTLYARPGCHLCDEARDALSACARTRRSRSRRSTSRPTTRSTPRYLERIPVVALDGEELFDYFVDEAALLRRILYREGG